MLTFALISCKGRPNSHASFDLFGLRVLASNCRATLLDSVFFCAFLAKDTVIKRMKSNTQDKRHKAVWHGAAGHSTCPVTAKVGGIGVVGHAYFWTCNFEIPFLEPGALTKMSESVETIVTATPPPCHTVSHHHPSITAGYRWTVDGSISNLRAA